MRTGRPTGYTEEIGLEICDRMVNEGKSLKDICDQPDMPKYKTVLKWKKNYPEFGELFARAREDRTHIWAEETISIADSVSTTRDEIDKARLRIDTRWRAAAKMNPKAYSDRVDLSVTGEISHSHTINRPPPLTRQEWLEERRRELAAPVLDGVAEPVSVAQSIALSAINSAGRESSKSDNADEADAEAASGERRERQSRP